MLSNFLQRKSYTRRSIYFTKLDDQLSSISRHKILVNLIFLAAVFENAKIFVQDAYKSDNCAD